MKVKAPAEDPAEKAARLQEQTRADAALVSSTQDVLDEEDRKRLRLLGALPTAGGAAAGAGSVMQPITTAGIGVTAQGVPPSGGQGGGGGGSSRVSPNRPVSV